MRLPPRRSSVFSTRLLAFLPSTPLLSGFRIAEQAQLSIIPTKRRCLDSHSSRESSSYRLAPKTALSATSLQSHLLAMLPSRRKPSALEVRHAQPLPEGSLARLDDSLSSPCPRATSEARNGPCALSRTAHPAFTLASCFWVRPRPLQRLSPSSRDASTSILPVRVASENKGSPVRILTRTALSPSR